jgi:unsaturated chondroitin disaccharide hydrolase
MSNARGRLRVSAEASRTQEQALPLVRERVGSTLAVAARDRIFPHAAPSATGAWTGTAAGSWTSGFWAGLLWYESALSGHAEDAETAEAWTLRLAPHLQRATHDIGFIFANSAALGAEIGGSAACLDLALRAARALAGMIHPAAQAIPTGLQAEIGAGHDDVTIDCMANLPLLWWARRTTGEERYLRTATAHADRTAAWHVKPDGRIIQSVHFDPASGEAVREETHQGSGVEGCWSRGQAWGTYGFAEAYRTTKASRFLALAERTADYYFARAGADPVPFYCFDAPATTRPARDSSAAAITAAGLLLLAESALDPAQRRRCLDRADALLAALVTGYLTPRGPADPRPAGMLLHSCYNFKAGWDTDHEIVWGDFFLLKSLVARARLA